ncbi:MAG: hypothetical protein ACR2IE_12645 [Candidatus Sumerlaeaceae bacterium]
MLTSSSHNNNAGLNNAGSYEAPRIELVLSADDVERQVHYAGAIISCPGGDCAPPPQ